METIATLKADLARKLHGISLSKVESPYNTIAEAGRNLLQRLDPQETIRTEAIENALFDNIYLYTSPSNLKGDKIIDLSPTDGRVRGDNYTKVLIEEFERNKTRKNFTVRYKNGAKFLKLNEDVRTGTLTISECNSTTGWAASSSATNLTLDQVSSLTGSASLNFDINDSSATAVLENSTLDDVDLSAFENEYAIFVWLYIPDATLITNQILLIGNDSSNYVSKTVTSAHAHNYVNGWNLLRFDLRDASETGTVDWSAIDFFRLTITHNRAGDTDFRLDSILAGVGETYEATYYGDALFRGTNGTWKTTPTSDTDVVQLEVDAYNILLYECAYVLSQELQGENGQFDETYFRRLLDGDGSSLGMYKMYHGSYPSQNKKARSTYYSLSKGVYGS